MTLLNAGLRRGLRFVVSHIWRDETAPDVGHPRQVEFSNLLAFSSNDHEKAGVRGGAIVDGTHDPRYGENMNLTVQIPDDLARSMNAAGGDLSRRVLEALALDEYKSGRLTKPELRKSLGFATGYELDGFLKMHHVWIEYDEQDLARERAGLDRLGL